MVSDLSEELRVALSGMPSCFKLIHLHVDVDLDLSSDKTFDGFGSAITNVSQK
jgi:hypothetical protein